MKKYRKPLLEYISFESTVDMVINASNDKTDWGDGSDWT